MATMQVGGSAVSNTSTKNDFGTIRRGGTISASTKWNSKDLGDTTENTSGPKLVSGLAMALSTGTFAYIAATKYIIRKVTATISGVANTVLQSGASDFGQRHAIHKIESMRTTFLSGLSWTADKDGMPTYTFTNSNLNTAYGNDDAARPSLAVPGELVYLPGGKTPFTDEYAAKTSG